MNSPIGIPIYINKNLILDLYSILINGYIESREELYLKNIDTAFRLQLGNKYTTNQGSKRTDPSDKNLVKDNSNNCSKDRSVLVDNRNGDRNQIRIRKIFTTFQFFNNMKSIMQNNNLVKRFDELSSYDSISPVEYLEFEGRISQISVQSQINTIVSLIESFDTKELDKLIPSSSLTNFTVISKQLKKLNEFLGQNNTTTMIIENSHFKSILNVNTNFFLDKNSYIYDDVNCNCKVFCKIIKVLNHNEKINLLSKTCEQDYYTKLLLQTKQFLDILNQNNILVPEMFSCEVMYPAIQAIPIAMYI
ncbi:hypothetical protein ABG79_01810 [Caloramator mitchellensis]|uniref:Uncharacterized protein n=1 Tax=Caloramator mitchellensis TaxID=908809 RepID=A0A0R3JVV0_CALMK|nr:hypothetical protein [Caloramator mitchellensis]KRQ86429.1 hypothetical protein ABG79_01810 [Caloramator mitchellensis]